MDITKSNSGFLTAAELAAILRVGPETVRLLARSGRIPSFRVGRSLRFDLHDVRRALARAARR